MSRDLTGRVILITGASAGIGAATALACARAGMDVALGARRIDRLRQVADQVEKLGRQALAVECDVDKDDQVNALVQKTIETFGRLDVAYANAGYGCLRNVLETSDADARAMFETNYWGTIRLLLAAAPHMLKARSGHLIICSSTASEIGIPMYGHYAATKAAQDAIASALRAELAGTGVYVSSVHPIGTRTEFFDRSRAGSGGAEFNLNTPAMLSQTAEHVADTIVRCIRGPRPEVWPSPGARFAVALTTAFPRVGAWGMRRLARGMRKGKP